METSLIIVAIVVVASIVLYIADRKTRGQPIEFPILAKIASFSGLATGGVVFALQSDAVSEAVSAVTDSAQDMFVGKPTF
jgi:hypothetical protein